LSKEFGERMTRMTCFLAVACLCLAAAGSGDCEKPSIVGCTLGMTVEQVRTLVPNSSVFTQADGTRVLYGTPPQAPLPSLKLGPALLTVSFDEGQLASTIWLRAETERDEQVVLKAARALWGPTDQIGGANLSSASGMTTTYLMNVVWETRCKSGPRLNVEVTGPPWKSTVHMGLVGDGGGTK
jgi:hypothetical protein